MHSHEITQRVGYLKGVSAQDRRARLKKNNSLLQQTIYVVNINSIVKGPLCQPAPTNTDFFFFHLLYFPSLSFFQCWRHSLEVCPFCAPVVTQQRTCSICIICIHMVHFKLRKTAICSYRSLYTNETYQKILYSSLALTLLHRAPKYPT